MDALLEEKKRVARELDAASGALSADLDYAGSNIRPLMFSALKSFVFPGNDGRAVSGILYPAVRYLLSDVAVPALLCFIGRKFYGRG